MADNVSGEVYQGVLSVCIGLDGTLRLGDELEGGSPVMVVFDKRLHASVVLALLRRFETWLERSPIRFIESPYDGAEW